MEKSNAVLGGFALLILQVLSLDLLAQQPTAFQFEASETAGIRRRSDVVSTRLLFKEPVAANAQFRLEHDGKPVSCQFRPVRNTGNRITAVDIDFIAHFQPWETRLYQVLAGLELDGIDLPGSGLTIDESGDAFRIRNHDHLVWTVRKDLRGLFNYMRSPDVDYVNEDSPGLGFRSPDGEFHLLSEKDPSRARIQREGAIACALEFIYDDWPTGGSSRVEMEFPRTKSWAHFTWSIRGRSVVSELVAEFRLILEGEEKLVDFGSGDFVYSTVRTNQTAVMEAGPRRVPPWAVYHGAVDAPKQLVVAAHQSSTTKIGGWVHLMDETRCTAAAVADFGLAGDDRIEVDGTGTMRISRKPEDNGQVLEFWVHFVGVPVHIGARTSAQSMQSPLVVRWLSTRH